MHLLYRIQRHDGRGPFIPGLSKYWVDEGRTYEQPDIITAFGRAWLREIPKGWHAGTACRTLVQLARWFNATERDRLRIMGFHPVALQAPLIIREDEHQVVFARLQPLNVGAYVVAWVPEDSNVD